MRTVAAGNLARLLYATVAIIVGLLVMSWLPQFSTGYDIQNQANIACNEAIKFARFGPAAAKDYNAMFEQGATRAGVRLKPTQYDFTVTHDRNKAAWVCDVRIAYGVDAELWTVGPILGMKPYHFVKKIHVEHEVPDTY